jgi:hypothetical protein
MPDTWKAKMLVDVYDGEDVIWTEEVGTDNIKLAEQTAINTAKNEGLSFTHVAARWEDGSRQTTIYDMEE